MNDKKATELLKTHFAPRVHQPEKNKHLDAVEKAIASVTEKICAEMFVDTLEEARKMMASMPNEHHVLELRDERGELEFLIRRRAQLVEKASAVKNG